MIDENFCFVCGFDMSFDVEERFVQRFTLCSCCSFHYGIEDFENESYMNARIHWINKGMPFGVDLNPVEIDWTIEKVLNQLGNLKKVDKGGTYFSKFKEYNREWNSKYDINLILKNWELRRNSK